MKARSARSLIELPVLYSFRRCPYVMRARMALTVAKIDVEHREVALRDKPAEMIIASPKATVPVLVLPGGRVIDESLEIMCWALAQNDPENWLANRDEGKALVATNDGPFKYHLDRMKYHLRYDSDPLMHQLAALELLIPLESRLASTAFLLGDKISLADIAIFPFIRQFARADKIAWENFSLPKMRAWLTGFIEQPLFKRAMTKYSLWTASADDRRTVA